VQMYKKKQYKTQYS